MFKIKMKNKRGLEIAINTVIILVLSILVLAFLILFFSEAGKSFIEKIRGYDSYSNVDSAIDNCNLYVDTDAKYNYCCEKKNIKYFQGEFKSEEKLNCLEISDKFGGVEGMDCGGINCR